MHILAKISLLTISLLLPACADSGAPALGNDPGPQAPVNDPDSGVFNPPGGGNGTSAGSNNSGSGNSGSTGSSGAGNSGSNGGSGSGGSGGGNGGGSGGGNGGGSGGGNGGGASGSQPVPEPGTLILFGTGLAGVGASLLRRRRRADKASA